jgi:hypothetical protein
VKRLIALALCIFGFGLIGLGCGGQTGTLMINIVVSPSDDPFAGAATVRISVGDSMHVTTAPVSGGHFSATYSRKPDATNSGPVTVEALDSAGNVIAHGSTPPVSLSAMNTTVSVWVGRPGKTQPAAAALPSPRSQIAACNVVGLGADLAGGADANGKPISDNVIYDVFTQDVIQTTMMSKPRAGAVAGPVGTVHSVALGGLTTNNMADSTMELFDPSSGLGLWSPVPVVFPARTQANAVILASGNTLVTGGQDGKSNPLADGAVISASGTVALTALATTMTTPRLGHAVAAAHYSDGDGAFIFGGLAASATTAVVSERLVNQSFSAYDVGQPNRVNATATTMPSGDILILGGEDTTGALASGFAVTPNLPMAAVKPLPQALSVAREGHTASLTGKELVVCGGADASGTAQASCDVLDATTYAIKRSFMLAAARKGHAAVVLDNGLVILAGGLGSDGNPLPSIEIYTP